MMLFLPAFVVGIPVRYIYFKIRCSAFRNVRANCEPLILTNVICIDIRRDATGIFRYTLTQIPNNGIHQRLPTFINGIRVILPCPDFFGQQVSEGNC